MTTHSTCTLKPYGGTSPIYAPRYVFHVINSFSIVPYIDHTHLILLQPQLAKLFTDMIVNDYATSAALFAAMIRVRKCIWTTFMAG